MDKKEKIVLVIIIVIILMVLLSPLLRYIFSNGKKVFVAVPDCYYFLADEGTSYQIIDELFELNEMKELGEDGLEKDTHIYHIFSWSERIERGVCFAGDYWNYPFKPTIIVDGTGIKKVRTPNRGTEWGPFGYYSNKYYYFYLENIKAEHVYTIEIICGKKSAIFKVMFHID